MNVSATPFQSGYMARLAARHDPSVPLLRWAGSKKKLLPLLMRCVPTRFERYVEPFAGSAVLYLRLTPRAALLSDINPEVIDAYEVVRSHPGKVWAAANAWPTDEATYYELRSEDPAAWSAVERVARFVYLNRFCFNGVYRTNKQGKFNVSRGKGHLGIPPREMFEVFACRIRDADLRCGDFESTLRDSHCGDFCYLDPPYVSSGGRDRGEYGAGSFKAGDLDRLTAQLVAASDRGAKLLLSYSYHAPLVDSLPGWHVKRLSVVRNVSGFTGSRRQAEEMLISN